MREPERDFGRLQDIIQAANNIASFTDGFTQEDLAKDKLRYFAVVKNVEIIGEAAYMLSLEFKEHNRIIPWNDIIRMRHVLVHGYAQISDVDLWQTATNDIHPLCEQVKHYLEEIDWNEWQQGEDPYTEIDNAAYKQAAESARRMKAKGYAVGDIAEITGLTVEEIEGL